MEWLFVALTVFVLVAEVAVSILSYRRVLGHVRDQSSMVVLRPRWGLVVFFSAFGALFLWAAGPVYLIATTRSNAIGGLLLMLLFFLCTFPFSWFAATGWIVLEPGMAHVVRGGGFRIVDVDSQQIATWLGVRGSGWSPTSRLDDPGTVWIRVRDRDGKRLFTVNYALSTHKGFPEWMNMYCPQAFPRSGWPGW